MNASAHAIECSESEWCDAHSATDLYASRFSGPIGDWMLQVQQAALQRVLTLPAGSTILDVGGGHAQLTQFLLDVGYRVTIHGSSSDAMGRATPFIRNQSCQWTEGPLDHLPHADASFDAVLSFRILPHVVAWHDLVQELCRVSRHLVIFDYPSLQSFNALSQSLFAMKQSIEQTTRPFTVFRDREVRDALYRYGCSATREVRQYVLPMAAHRALGVPGVSRWVESLLRMVGLTSLVGSPVVICGTKGNGQR